MPLVELPPFISSRSAPTVIAACNQAIRVDGDVDIDGEFVKFVDPFGIAMLGATFFAIKENGANVRVHRLSAEIGSYLQRMDVFTGVDLIDCKPQESKRSDRADALLELTRLDYTASADEAAYQLARALVGHIPGTNPDEAPDEMTGYTSFDRLVEPLQYALSELLENGMTHARREGHGDARVWVASQYYPSNDLVRLGVVDNGCGFLGSLRHHPELRSESHLHAILTALRPRVSCNRDLGILESSANQGVGLTTTHRIAQTAGGGMVIVSGDGLHRTFGRNYQMECPWQGVGIALHLSRKLLKNVQYRHLLPRLDVAAPPLRFE